MRFVVYGAGAVGGVVGGRLAQHGHEVVLIARGDHHDVIRDRGLRLVVPDERACDPHDPGGLTPRRHRLP